MNYLNNLPIDIQDKIWILYHKEIFNKVLQHLIYFTYDSSDWSSSESEEESLNSMYPTPQSNRYDDNGFLIESSDEDEISDPVSGSDEWKEMIGCRWSYNMNRWTMWSETDSD